MLEMVVPVEEQESETERKLKFEYLVRNCMPIQEELITLRQTPTSDPRVHARTHTHIYTTYVT